jgi:hypothetical protein
MHHAQTTEGRYLRLRQELGLDFLPKHAWTAYTRGGSRAVLHVDMDHMIRLLEELKRGRTAADPF